MLEGNHRSIMAEGHGTGTCPAPSSGSPSPVSSGGGDHSSFTCLQSKFCKKNALNSVPRYATPHSSLPEEDSLGIPFLRHEADNVVFSNEHNGRWLTSSTGDIPEIPFHQEETPPSVSKSVNYYHTFYDSHSSPPVNPIRGDEFFDSSPPSKTGRTNTYLSAGSAQSLEPPPLIFCSHHPDGYSESMNYISCETLNPLEFRAKPYSSGRFVPHCFNFTNLPPPRVKYFTTWAGSYQPFSFAHGC